MPNMRNWSLLPWSAVQGLLRFAVLNLLRHSRQTFFGLLVIVLGVTGLVIARGFVLDVFQQLGEMTIRSQLGHLQATMPGFRESGAGRADEYLLVEAAAVEQTLRKDPRVREVMGRLTFSGVISAGRNELAIEGEGVEPHAEARLGTHMTVISGKNLKSDQEEAIVLGEGAARRLRVRPGDWVNLTASTVDGSLNAVELRVSGVFRSFSKEYDERTVRIPLSVVQNLLQTRGVTMLVVQLRKTEDTASVLAALDHWGGKGAVEIQPWYRISDFYESTRALYERQFGILQIIAVTLIAMSVLGSFNMTVLERTAEFGTMRALGNRPNAVLGLILIEALVLGIVGAAVAIVVSAAVAAGVSWIGIPMPPPPNSESGYTARIVISGEAMGWSALVGILSAFLGALLPALRVMRMPLTVALGRSL